MWSSHIDALYDLEAGCISVHHEGAQPFRARRLARACYDGIEIGDTAIRDPGLGAIQHVVAAFPPRRGGHGSDVGTRLWLRQRKGRYPITGCDLRQVAAP